MIHLLMIAATVVLFVTALAINEYVLPSLEFIRGINWIYLPAGIRLLSTLLFGASGVVGLLLASWLVNFTYFFPDDFGRAFMGGILSAVAPYLVYRLARSLYGLEGSLANLTPSKLLLCSVAYAIANPTLIHMWLMLGSQPHAGVPGLFVMMIGDLLGALIVLYTFKLALSLAQKPSFLRR